MITSNGMPSKQRSLESYAAAVASASPTPGGGSVAAVVASLAASLAEMVCNLTLAGKNPPDDPGPLRSAAAESQRLRAALLDLATADENAYAGYRAASALPRGTDEEKAARRDALDRALVHSADIPLEMARTGLAVLEQLQVAAQYGTKHALSDASTGSVLAESAIKSALFNVRVNAGLMRSEVDGVRYAEEANAIETKAHRLATAVLQTVEQRTHPGKFPG